MPVLRTLISILCRGIQNLFSGPLTHNPRPRVNEIDHGDLYRAFKKQKDAQDDADKENS